MLKMNEDADIAMQTGTKVGHAGSEGSISARPIPLMAYGSWLCSDMGRQVIGMLVHHCG
jgi:hypothetical protein